MVLGKNPLRYETLFVFVRVDVSRRMSADWRVSSCCHVIQLRDSFLKREISGTDIARGISRAKGRKRQALA
jgi:hypothetical protein